MFELSEILGGFGLSALIIVIYWYWTRKKEKTEEREPPLPALPKQDLTLQQLREFDGVKSGRRILMAISGNIYDVSARADFYGPGGPYGVFAGRDASRGLATMSLSHDDIKDDYDDLPDLTSMERGMLKDWESQFKFRYPVVGKLLKPGEMPAKYEEETLEDQPNQPSFEKKKE